MWISLIQREPAYDSCRYVIEQAERGEVQIWTSAFTLAEVFKRRCGGEWSGLDIREDEAFEDFIEQDFVVRVQVDSDVGKAARRLLRAYPQIGKPQDAIHLATALIENLDELHTFDREDLLGLNGKLARQGGGFLKICRPPKRPDPNAGTMFAASADDDGDEAEIARAS